MTDNRDTITCDVLVAGTGAGGFAAAHAARLSGLDVLMVEKEPVVGGTTAYSAGVIWVPANHHQARHGVTDTRDDALAYLAHHLGNFLDRDRAQAFVDHAPVMLERFEREGLLSYTLAPTWADYHPDEPGASQGGRSLVPDEFDGRELGDWFDRLRPPIKTMMAFGGMMVGRNDIPHVFRMSHDARSALHIGKMVARYARDRLRHRRGTRLVNGNAMIARLLKAALEREIGVWTSAPVVDLTMRDGRVAGARVMRDGRPVAIVARRGVVLATGGFPGNSDLKRALYGHVSEGKAHVPLPPPGNAGDGLRLAERAGGLFHRDVDQPCAWTPVSLVPQPDGRPIPFPHFVDRGKPGIISVDRRGNRFANEAKSYHVYVPALIEACRNDPQVEGWIVADHRAIRMFGLGAVGPAPVRLGPFLRSGYLKRGDTPADLARACGIDPVGLTRTIAAFNGPAARGEDPAFQRGSDAYQRFNGAAGHRPNPCVGPLDQAPFYAVRIIPSELGTFAGIRTDARARVVTATGEPVPGLYAVGNDAASVMGGTYPGAGITLGPALTFGYLAGLDMASAGASPSV
jgi:succinate dehydrogenase/fumarate reductase flavoprotein subunit